LPPEFIGIGWGEGPWSDRAASLAGSEEFARGGGKLTRLEFPRTEIQAYGDVAFVYSTYLVEFTSEGQPVVQEGRATEVFVRRRGKWLHPGWHLDSGK
jgi:ketosteroid isomerase-like protein